jgi:hypothetical protein
LAYRYLVLRIRTFLVGPDPEFDFVLIRIQKARSLTAICRELMNKSKALQQEILLEGRGRGTEKEFYKKNSRYLS